MTEKIRVTQTSVYEYTPDYDDDFYLQSNITDINEAMKVDIESLKKGETSIDEIAEEVSTTFQWEIVNE